MIPHPLSLVVNVDFYSCLPTIISYALSDGTFSVIEAIAVGYCREQKNIAVNQGLLGWAKGYCRGQRAIAVCKGLLPWAEGYCCGPKVIIVGKELLPWAKGYCRIHVYIYR